MTISIGLVALCVLGALMYVLASNGKASELGRLMFACALLALCFTMSRGSLRLG